MIILKIIGWIIFLLWSFSVIFSIKYLYRNYQLYKIRLTEWKEKELDNSMERHMYGQGLRRSILIFVFEILALSIIFYFLV